MTCDLTGVARANVPYLWQHIVALLDRALAYNAGEYSLEDIYQGLEQGTFQLWIAAKDTELKGIVITELARFPQKYSCHCLLVAGNEAETWQELEELIADWAFQQGADAMRFAGREGWKRLAQQHGYQKIYSVYERPLRGAKKETH